ncbi:MULTISPECIES: FAD-dependent oxidoreductase [Saccharothrix]|uniref:FAD-dependent oxidoreductase n=1 Tax=Saccharothrix TaxID=2071 RepID=UPI0009F86B54|nr:FAD-dependent oxidoreductase [Saccharothrix sp. CB00851]
MNRTVAIIGEGYGGAAARDAFVNAAGSLRTVTRPEWAGHMFFPFDTLLTRGTVIRDRAVSVDPGGVALGSGRHVEADYLVLATGSSYAYPAKPVADSVGDALDDFRRTHEELAGADRVLTLGAGPVGLELAATVTAYKGADLFTSRFTEQFGPTAARFGATAV